MMDENDLWCNEFYGEEQNISITQEEQEEENLYLNKDWKPLNVKQFFITYPQADGLSRKKIKEFYKQKLGVKYDGCIISKEDHQPKLGDKFIGKHFHVYLFLSQSYHITNCRTYDIKIGDKVYHPNIQPVKKKAAVVRYVIKSDKKYLTDNINVIAYLKSTETKKGYGFHQAAEQLIQGKTVKTLAKDPEAKAFVLNHKRKMDEYVTLLKEIENDKPKPIFKGVVINETDDSSWIKVINWIHLNFLRPRRFKQKQLWIWGADHDIGKSFFFLKILSCYLKMYPWLKGDSQDSSLIDSDYILIDEMCGGITINDMKRLSQMGGDYNTKLRYAGIHTISKNIPLVVTSQKSISQTYINCSIEDIEALQCRFLSVNIKSLYLIVPINRDIDWPNQSYPWYQNEDDSIESDDFIDPSELLNVELPPFFIDTPPIFELDPIVDNYDSYDYHSENSNEVNKRQKK